MHVVEVFSALCPWLVLIWSFQRLATVFRSKVRGWPLLVLSGAGALGVLLVPIEGIRIARWVAGVVAGCSVPFTGLLALAVCERTLERPLFSEREWTTAWGVGAGGGLLLYPWALGLGAIDPYEWGWRFGPLFIVSGALTAWLIWRQNRFGLLLLLAVVAFQLRLLESTNYWDYLLDPVYCLTSFVVVGRRLALSTRTSLTNRFS